MKFRSVAFLSMFLCVLCTAGQAFAQDEEASSVVVLKFGATGVPQDVMDLFYMELHEHIRAHPEMEVAAGGEVTINDLILMAGCEAPTPDCLSSLQDFVEGDRIVFGQVSSAEDVYRFDARMFDFASATFVREIEGFTLRGDQRQIQYEIPSVIEALLYGDVGTLQVRITGGGTPEVLVNGVSQGRAPLLAESLPLGEVEVVVRGDDGVEQSERVVLRRNQTAEVTFAVEGIRPIEPQASATSPYLIPGVVVTAVGVAGVVVGVLGQTQLSDLETEASSFVAQRSALRPEELTRANELQTDMNSAHTMRVIGYSVGAAGVVAGSVMLFKAFTGSGPAAASKDDPTTPRISWQVAPASDGFGLSLGGRF